MLSPATKRRLWNCPWLAAGEDASTSDIDGIDNIHTVAVLVVAAFLLGKRRHASAPNFESTCVARTSRSDNKALEEISKTSK